MVGGFLYELLTAGSPPFGWLLDNPQLFLQRRATADPVPVPGAREPLPGLLGKSVLEAAVIDRVSLPWCVQAGPLAGSGTGSQARCEALGQLLTRCLARDPAHRPKLSELQGEVDRLLAAERREEVEEVEVGGAAMARPPRMLHPFQVPLGGASGRERRAVPAPEVCDFGVSCVPFVVLSPFCRSRHAVTSLACKMFLLCALRVSAAAGSLPTGSLTGPKTCTPAKRPSPGG